MTYNHWFKLATVNTIETGQLRKHGNSLSSKVWREGCKETVGNYQVYLAIPTEDGGSRLLLTCYYGIKHLSA